MGVLRHLLLILLASESGAFRATTSARAVSRRGIAMAAVPGGGAPAKALLNTTQIVTMLDVSFPRACMELATGVVDSLKVPCVHALPLRTTITPRVTV